MTILFFQLLRPKTMEFFLTLLFLFNFSPSANPVACFLKLGTKSAAPLFWATTIYTGNCINLLNGLPTSFSPFLQSALNTGPDSCFWNASPTTSTSPHKVLFLLFYYWKAVVLETASPALCSRSFEPPRTHLLLLSPPWLHFSSTLSQHARNSVTPGSLHLLFPLPGTLFCSSPWLPFSSSLSLCPIVTFLMTSSSCCI